LIDFGNHTVSSVLIETRDHGFTPYMRRGHNLGCVIEDVNFTVNAKSSRTDSGIVRSLVCTDSGVNADNDTRESRMLLYAARFDYRTGPECSRVIVKHRTIKLLLAESGALVLFDNLI
jgi:hypothetical protein